MRRLIIILFCLISISANATIYYVATTGNDASADPTNIATPWKTWQKAFSTAAVAQDTVYFRGGIYPPYSTSVGVSVTSTIVDGTYNHPTCFFAYPADWAAGNYPVMDCQTMTNYQNNGIYLEKCHNLYIKGLTVKNARQTNTVAVGMGWRITCGSASSGNEPNNIRIENCTSHHNGGRGFSTGGFDTLYFINCDAYMNCDSLTTYDPGGTGVGFAISDGNSNSAEDAYVYIHGCRAWRCADQGLSINYPGVARVDSVWTFNNGNFMMGASKGSGFKFWYNDADEKNILVLQLVVRNCIIADNEYYGINWTDRNMPTIPEIRAHLYNNFSYRNGKLHPSGWTGGYGWVDDVTTSDTTGRWDHLSSNNLSYDNYGRYGIYDIVGGVYNGSNNYWQNPPSVNDADFVSLDTAQLRYPRQSSGELPIITFGHLAETSNLVNAGINVGLPYSGSAPDVGWVEYDEGTPVTDPLNSTLTPYNVNIRQVTAGGTVTSDGGGTISARGICWGLSANPDLTDNVITVAGTTGAFITVITGLSSSTTYYVQSYATNEYSTVYGGNVSFTTPDSGVGWHGGKAVYHNGKIVIVK